MKKKTFEEKFIGKRMMGNTYVHKSYAYKHKMYPTFESINKNGIEFDLVKFNENDGSVTLLRCDCFDEYLNPRLMEFTKFDSDGDVVMHKMDGTRVYHKKEMMVLPDYRGFDVKASEEWTKEYEAILLDGEKATMGYVKKWKPILERAGLLNRKGCENIKG